MKQTYFNLTLQNVNNITRTYPSNMVYFVEKIYKIGSCSTFKIEQYDNASKRKFRI